MEIRFDKDKLKQLMEGSGYRTEYIANQLGIKQKTLRLMVGGHTKPSLPVIKLMSLFFKVNESYFHKESA